ncbi:MAG: Crp/Fnr family transcriptional regulator [Elusimicrobia bacterium]|nr:Crp/Fnr family transcriptional regulator [Elusimicrobiota bacterium]
MPPEQWRRLEGRLSVRRFKKGECFIEPGQPSLEAAIVMSGLFRFYYTDLDGREATKAFRGKGELLAAYAELLDKRPSRTTVEALEDSEIMTVRYERVTALYKDHACWQELGRVIAEDHYRQRERREQELLMDSATERYQTFMKDRPDLAARLPKKIIASYLGITPVALSRITAPTRTKTKRSA